MSQIRGHSNYLLAGCTSDEEINFPADLSASVDWVRFDGADLPFSIVGMSDVMPYSSARFRDLTENQLKAYERAFVSKTAAMIKKIKPDVIHAHHLWIMTSAIKRSYPSYPLIASSHGSDIRQLITCPHLAERVIAGCRHLFRVLALTKKQQQMIHSLYKIPDSHIVVAGTGFNDSLFTLKIKPKVDPVILVYAGKLSSAKGVPWLLHALQNITDISWQLHIAGEGAGSEKEAIVTLASEISENVHFHGSLSQEKLAELFQKAHVFILPSLYEGFALVILEALACGCRIVATELPAIQEMFSEPYPDYIQTVTMPRLKDMDKPLKQDEQSFINNLSAAIRKQMIAATNQPDLPEHEIKRYLAPFKWSNIFNVIQKSYHETIQMTSTKMA
ncbi:glycosyltransferase family 4 protein [bacterium]|nr:glycosyltransferase family 4 protein [candidate division CSSED10-310 bacterium]